MSRTEPASAAAASQLSRIRWQFEPDVPTSDFFDGIDLDNDWALQEAVENFIFKMQTHRFHTWEGVICDEQGIPPTPEQQEAADELLCFGPSEDEDPSVESRVLTINDIPRPTEAWYETLRKIAARLLRDPYDVTASRYEVFCDGWTQLEECLVQHAAGLSLPENARLPLDVIPAQLRHRLRLQHCFYGLPSSGYESISLDDPDNSIDWFIDDLRASREAVEYFDLTLDGLLSMVKLPDDQRAHFVRLIERRLDLDSTSEPLAKHLFGDCAGQASDLSSVVTGVDTDGAGEQEIGSTERPPAESIKLAILHPDSRIRQMAVNYFARSYTGDATVMPLIIEALEKHGKEDAYALVGAAVRLPQTAETIDWILSELNDERSTSYDSYTYNLQRVLCATDPRLLQPQENEIAVAQHLAPGAYEIITDRIEMFSWDAERCWRELREPCELYQDATCPGDARLVQAERIVEALARHGGSEEQVLDLLARQVDMDADMPMKWMEPLIVQLAGRLRLEAAVPLLVDKMLLDDDLLSYECAVALKRIGSDAVVRALAETFEGAPWGFRFVAASVLEDARSDLAVRSTLELLPRETDVAVGRRLRATLLGQFAYAGIEPVRQWLLERGFSDFEDRVLRNDLLRTCKLLGRTFPEYQQWKDDYEAEQGERLRRLDEMQENPMAGLLYAMEQLTGEKTGDVIKEIEEEEAARAVETIVREQDHTPHRHVGRNEPCPCGSGKKYKKCCMRKSK